MKHLKTLLLSAALSCVLTLTAFQLYNLIDSNQIKTKQTVHQVDSNFVYQANFLNGIKDFIGNLVGGNSISNIFKNIINSFGKAFGFDLSFLNSSNNNNDQNSPQQSNNQGSQNSTQNNSASNNNANNQNQSTIPYSQDLTNNASSDSSCGLMTNQECATFQYQNEMRMKNNLMPLEVDNICVIAARKYAEDLIKEAKRTRNNGCSGHRCFGTSPQSRYTSVSLSGETHRRTATENLQSAWSTYGHNFNPVKPVNAWQASCGHCKTMYAPNIRYGGIGLAFGSYKNSNKKSMNGEAYQAAGCYSTDDSMVDRDSPLGLCKQYAKQPSSCGSGPGQRSNGFFGGLFGR